MSKIYLSYSTPELSLPRVAVSPRVAKNEKQLPPFWFLAALILVAFFVSGAGQHTPTPINELLTKFDEISSRLKNFGNTSSATDFAFGPFRRVTGNNFSQNSGSQFFHGNQPRREGL